MVSRIVCFPPAESPRLMMIRANAVNARGVDGEGISGGASCGTELSYPAIDCRSVGKKAGHRDRLVFWFIRGQAAYLF